MPRVAALALVVALLGLGTACRDDRVRLAHQPQPGDRYSYRVEVRAVAVTTVGQEGPRRTVTDEVFDVRHDIMDVNPAGSVVNVRLEEKGDPPRTFVVRLDRAAQLAEVQRIEGLPASALGDLALSEIFPAAAAAPPDRSLAPGDRWSIDKPVRLAALEPSRLLGQGRLASLGVVAGREVATVQSTYRLDVQQQSEERHGGLVLKGSQSTRATAAYDLDDGAVMSVRASTRGTFDLTLMPPAGVEGRPIPGTLRVDVHSTTRRLL